MRMPVTTSECNCATVSVATGFEPGILFSGQTNWGAPCVFLGNAETGGWERFVRLKGENRPPKSGHFMKLFADQSDPIVYDYGSGTDCLVLVRTGMKSLSRTKIQQHGVYGSSGTRRIDQGTVLGKDGKPVSREELWVVPEGEYLLVLTAIGGRVRIENDGGALFAMEPSEVDFYDPITDRILEIAGAQIERASSQKAAEKPFFWIISHARDNPSWFSMEARKRFREIFEVNSDKMSDKVSKSTAWLQGQYPDGRFGGASNVVDFKSAKGAPAEHRAKKAKRSAEDRELRQEMRGPSNGGGTKKRATSKK